MNYSKSSKKKLSTVDGKLQVVFREAIKLGLIDITIVQGVRGEEDQNRYFLEGRSKVKWPFSKHNVERECEKAEALDAFPYVNDKPSYNYYHCCFLAGVIMAVAEKMGVKIRWGGNWDQDGEPVTDQKFQDFGHYELVD